MTVPTWTPGQEIKDGAYDPSPPPRSTQGYFSQSVLYFLMIGLPLLGALSIGLCVWGIVRAHDKRARTNVLIYAVPSGPGIPEGQQHS